MAFRSLGRAGSEIGRRVAGRSSRSNTALTLKHAGAECSASSWTGHFGRSRAPSYRPGTSGASTQLFKLVETDLMSKELTRYDSSDAQLLGLHSIQDVLSKLAAVSTTPSPSTPIVTAAVPPTAATQTSLEEPSDSTANMRQEKVLSAWGQVPRIAGANVEEAGEVMAPSANVCVLEAEEGMTKMAIKRTYQPSTLKRKRMHGFLYRSKSRLGKKILRRRLEKGRWRMGI